MIANSELPAGWKSSTLGEVVSFQKGKKPDILFEEPAPNLLPYVDIKAFEEKFIKKFGEPHKGVVVQEDDIVLVWDGARSGLVGKSIKGILGSTLSLVKPLNNINRNYLFYFIQGLYHEINTNTKGIGIPHVNPVYLSSLPFPLAPLPKQERIVSRIEELFSDLETGVAALERVRAGLKRYKASVLKFAFEGKLQTHDDNDENAYNLIKRMLHERRVQWETNIRIRRKDPKKVVFEELQFHTADELTKLPQNWRWVSWEMILANESGTFRRGPFGSSLKKSMFVQSGFKVYEQYCAINDDCSFGRYYITPELFEELKSFEVKSGDYLISCSGVTLGRITRVPENSEKGIINQALLRVRINDNIIDHKYFMHYFRSPYFQKKLFDSSTGTAIPNVKGVKELKILPIPLPPLEEQRRIVVEVERRLSVVNEIEFAVEAGLVRAGRLRQAILRSAFEGRL